MDQYIGSRLRSQRILCHLNQEQLGKKLDITFQQVQKYEKGINGISAGRLYEISKVLKVDMAYFFDGMEKEVQAKLGEEGNPFIHQDIRKSNQGAALLEGFAALASNDQRAAVLHFVTAFAQDSSSGSNKK
ncbi:MAG: helix-turn-helix domain-containing protein [Parvibaculales bacterium]